MKTIQQIAKEFQEVVKGTVHSSTIGCVFYNAISGYYKNGYYDVYFRVVEDRNEIDIYQNTKNLDEIVSIIRTIEPLAKITMVKSIFTESYKVIEL